MTQTDAFPAPWQSLASLDIALAVAAKRRRAFDLAASCAVLLPICWCLACLGATMALAWAASLLLVGSSAGVLALAALSLLGGCLLIFCLSFPLIGLCLLWRGAAKHASRALSNQITALGVESDSRQAERYAIGEARALSACAGSGRATRRASRI